MTVSSTLLDKISDLAAAGVLASFGGAAQFLYQLHKGDKPFSFMSFGVCVLLSFFVGQVVGSLIPSGLEHYHDGLLLMSGFCVFPILDIINDRMIKLIRKWVDKELPVETTTETNTDVKQP